MRKTYNIKIIKKYPKKWWNNFINKKFEVYKSDGYYFLTDKSLKKLAKKQNKEKVYSALIYTNCVEII